MLIDNYNIQLNCLVQSQQQKQRSLTKKQYFPKDFNQLLNSVTKHRLTEALKLLEEQGIAPEAALSLLKSFRQIEKSLTSSTMEVAA